MAEPSEAPQMTLTDDGRVHMLDRTGSPVIVARGDVDNALAAGYGLEGSGSVAQRQLERERGTLGQQALTAGEGALEGATFGLGTAAAVDLLGDDYRQAALERRQVNPNAHLVGQVAGAVAPVALSGGSSLAARGLAGVGAPARGAAALGSLAERGAARLVGGLGTGTLGRAAARGIELGAAGATEGALQGLGGSIADAALQDTEWTADKALAAMADGAWYGLGTGGAVGAGSSVISSAGKAALSKMMGGKGFQQSVKELAESRAVKQVTGNNAAIYNELTKFGANPERINRVGRKILDRDLPITGSLDDAARAVDQQTASAVERMKGVAKRLDDAGVKVDAKEVLGRVDDQIAKLKAVEIGDYQAVAAKLEDTIAPFRRAVEGPGAAGARRVTRGPDGKRVLSELGGKEYSFTDIWELRKKLDDTIKWSSRQANPATDALKQLRAEFDDSLTRTLEGKAGTADDLLAKGAETPQGASAVRSLRDEWKAAKEDFSDFKTIADGIDEQRNRMQKNRWLSPSDYGVAGGSANLLGTIAGISTGSLGIGALTGMATSAVGGLAHKFIRERGSGIIAKMADRIAKSELRNTTAARVLAGLEKPSRLATRAETLRKNNERRKERFTSALDHVQRFTQDAEYADAQMRDAFGEIAAEQPEVAQKMMMGLSGDMAYLASIAPQGLSNGAKSFTPLKEKPSYTKDQQRRFLSAVQALSDPGSVAEDLAEGDIDLDAITALQVRRPREYADLREKVMLACAEREDELPYKRVNFLSLAFNFAGDESHEPGTIAAIQASVPPAQHPGPSSTAIPPDAGENLTLPNEAALGA
jgi:hypothetical protein